MHGDLPGAAAAAFEQRERHELAVFFVVRAILGVEDGDGSFDEEPLLGIAEPAHEGVARRRGSVRRRGVGRRLLRRALGAFRRHDDRRRNGVGRFGDGPVVRRLHSRSPQADHPRERRPESDDEQPPPRSARELS